MRAHRSDRVVSMSAIQLIRLNSGTTRKVFRQIAELHADQLKVGLLASFGIPFLERFYRRAATDPLAILIASVKDGEVIGFVMGCVSPFKFHFRMLVRLWPVITWQLLRRPGHMYRGLSVARYVGSKSSGPAPELLSIVVDPRFQRSGAGAELFRDFKLKLLACDVHKFRVTASETQKAALPFYRKHGGIVISETNLGGLRSFTFVMPVI